MTSDNDQHRTLLLCPALCSNYHVELNPSDVGNNDRYVVQEVIKELAKNRPLDVAGGHLIKQSCAAQWTDTAAIVLASGFPLVKQCS